MPPDVLNLAKTFMRKPIIHLQMSPKKVTIDKIRQSSRGMPAVIIRMLDALSSVMNDTTSDEQRRILTRQADMILRSAEESVTEPNDLADIRFRYARLIDRFPA